MATKSRIARHKGIASTHLVKQPLATSIHMHPREMQCAHCLKNASLFKIEPPFLLIRFPFFFFFFSSVLSKRPVERYCM